VIQNAFVLAKLRNLAILVTILERNIAQAAGNDDNTLAKPNDLATNRDKIRLAYKKNEEEQHACHGPQQMTAGAGQIALLLLARRADVHVDFHAHLHFDYPRSFPGHLGLPSQLAQHLRHLRVRPPHA